MTDQQPPDATPAPESGQPAAATPPPTFAAPPPPSHAPMAPAPAPAAPAPAPTPAPASSAAKASGSPLRPNVAVVGVIALLAVIGTIVSGGGSIDSASPSRPGTPGVETGLPSSTGSAGGGGPAIPGTAGPTGGSGGGASPQIPNVPFDANVLGPSGASMAPTEYNAILQWRLPGNWLDKIEEWQTSFPMVGYQLTEDIGGSVNDNESGEAIAYFYEVIPVGGDRNDLVGYLTFQQDPDDPEGSTYLVWSTEL